MDTICFKLLGPRLYRETDFPPLAFRVYTSESELSMHKKLTIAQRTKIIIKHVNIFCFENI